VKAHNTVPHGLDPQSPDLLISDPDPELCLWQTQGFGDLRMTIMEFSHKLAFSRAHMGACVLSLTVSAAKTSFLEGRQCE
jgi:hypothetical protein